MDSYIDLYNLFQTVELVLAAMQLLMPTIEEIFSLIGL